MPISQLCVFILIYNDYVVLVYFILITKTFSQRARVIDQELLAVLRMADDDMNLLPNITKLFGSISDQIKMATDSNKFWTRYIMLTTPYALCHAGSLTNLKGRVIHSNFAPRSLGYTSPVLSTCSTTTRIAE